MSVMKKGAIKWHNKRSINVKFFEDCLKEAG